MTDKASAASGQKRQLTGEVVSDRMDKTVVVYIERRVKHPLYGKVIRRSSRISAHDERNSCRLGDRVVIQECRPISRTKSWRVVSVQTGPAVTAKRSAPNADTGEQA